MKYPRENVRTIYVDSASCDGSVEAARKFGAAVIELKPLKPTAALGRNAGWRSADGEYVLFLDGDTVLHPGFVTEALRYLENPETAIVWGHRREMRPEISIYNRVLDLDWIYPPGFTEFCGGDALVRRSVLAEVNGFDESLIAGEEPEMCRRIRALGYRILHIDHPMTGHDLAITKWKQYWRRATRAGHAYAEVSERFRDSSMPFWEKDASRNRKHALVLLATFAAAVLSSVCMESLWPISAWVSFFFLLALRTAVKVKWKYGSLFTRFLYGIHSHVQQIPIFWGQVQYARKKRHGAKQELIEYKGPAA
jgi:cellulose synthase/poly-beta-1,6-N-acetylglucosamine synthase-like glycosyltransferase